MDSKRKAEPPEQEQEQERITRPRVNTLDYDTEDRYRIRLREALRAPPIPFEHSALPPWEIRRWWTIGLFRQQYFFDLAQRSSYTTEFLRAYSDEHLRPIFEDRLCNDARDSLPRAVNIGILHGQIIDAALDQAFSDIIHNRYSDLFDPGDVSIAQRTVRRYVGVIERDHPGLYESHRELSIGRALLAHLVGGFQLHWDPGSFQRIALPITLDHLRRRVNAYLAPDPPTANPDSEHGP
jgi:hypothetical protein